MVGDNMMISCSPMDFYVSDVNSADAKKTPILPLIKESNCYSEEKPNILRGIFMRFLSFCV